MATADLLTRVVVWQDTDLPNMTTAPRPGSGHSRVMDFIDRPNDVAFRVGTTSKPEGVGRDFFSPRHHHTFDQVRFYFRGGMRYGKNEVYGAGDCIYIPGGVFYGPMEYADQDETCHLNFQFQGNSGIPYFGSDEFIPARERLEQRGKFEGGIYIGDDGKKQDGWEALLEETVGHKVSYPKPTVMNYIVVRTANLPWHPVADAPDVGVKYVGHFTEVGPNILLFNLPKGTTLPGGERGVNQIWVVGEGEVRFGDELGRTFVPAACRFAPADTPYEEIESVKDAQVLLVQWAREGQLFPPAW